MSVNLDERFCRDFGERVYGLLFDEVEHKDMVARGREIATETHTIGYAWYQGRSECESPIEEMLFEKILFANDGYKTVMWEDAPGAHEIPKEYFQTWFEVQAEIGPYRADFLFTTYCDGFKRRLVVECDGHDFHEKTKEQAKRDKARDRYFAKQGITVIRFSGSEIYQDAEACKVEIEVVLSGLMDECLAQAGLINGRSDR